MTTLRQLLDYAVLHPQILDLEIVIDMDGEGVGYDTAGWEISEGETVLVLGSDGCVTDFEYVDDEYDDDDPDEVPVFHCPSDCNFKTNSLLDLEVHKTEMGH